MSAIALPVSLPLPASPALPGADKRSESNLLATKPNQTNPGESNDPATKPDSAAAGEGQALTAEQQQQLTELAARDREVRAHEAAHANIGGVHAGAPSYTYTRGPDGNNYAVAGEVSIDVSPVPGDPQATLAKAQLVRRAALAPAQPSAQDRSVASAATALEQAARQELQTRGRDIESGSSTANPAVAAFAQIAAPADAEPGAIISELV